MLDGSLINLPVHLDRNGSLVCTYLSQRDLTVALYGVSVVQLFGFAKRVFKFRELDIDNILPDLQVCQGYWNIGSNDCGRCSLRA